MRRVLGNYLDVSAREVSFQRELDHWVDLYELGYLLEHKQISERQLFERLKELYRGVLLAEMETSAGHKLKRWLYLQRQAVQEKISTILYSLTEHYLQHADFSYGFKTTHWWLTMEPENELAHRLRMQLFWSSNQHAAPQCCNTTFAMRQLPRLRHRTFGRNQRALPQNSAGRIHARRRKSDRCTAAVTSEAQHPKEVQQLFGSRKRSCAAGGS